MNFISLVHHLLIGPLDILLERRLSIETFAFVLVLRYLHIAPCRWVSESNRHLVMRQHRGRLDRSSVLPYLMGEMLSDGSF